ncbi:two-component system response regulator [Anaerosporomusa subterranea]|uniref:Two-component system response regulator n=1 Tax=Anaerosporomusa subterranea TaxID=1794912 RepID=A0A154BMY1_ANASB|nr:response regulator transcription factor [Anaerosporomusa subterranea]KYZ75334.1 two-component system response regulator [Anaerosporomusa subterranea]
MAIRILLADDHKLVRAGLKMLIENDASLEVVGEASDGNQALHFVEEKQPDITILDIAMPGMDGIQCIKEIKTRGLRTKIIVLTMYEDENYIKEVMLAGADAYIKKSSVDSELFKAINHVVRGEVYLNPADSRALISVLRVGQDKPDDNDPYSILSPREREVLKLHVRGLSMREIGEHLAVSIKTVDTYKTRMMEKLNFTKKSELIDYALKYGLLSDKS